ncbi:MAG: dUTP diphosphatase, partial [Clostridia bacterium]|nr:dUTP diphosphatase [Clostridia bacterium]
MNLNVKLKLSRGMEAPAYATDGSAAVDLRAAIDEGTEVVIAPGDRALIPMGISIAPETRDVVAVIAGRSGLGIKNGVTLAN